MRVWTVSAVALLTLAGCGALGGPTDKQALIKTCMQSGSAETTCSCEAEALEKNLPPELFKKFAQAVGREEQNQLEYLNSLTVEELLAFSAVTNDLEACAGAAASGG
jgi:hypothetical protein